MLILYFHWNAVCAQKVAMCLAEKGLDYTPHHIDLSALEQLQDWYLKLNPGGVVPTLVHDGTVLLESTVINEYLDDAFPDTALKPADPRSRARMRWWSKQVDDIVHPSIRPISFTQFVAPRARELSPQQLSDLRVRTPKKEISELWRRVASAPYSQEELSEYLYKIESVLERMEETLGRDLWLAGEAFSLADVNMTPYFRRLVQLGKTGLWAERPAVAGWLERIRVRPSFARLDALRERFDSARAPEGGASRDHGL
jgi:glutathione S-transferase